MVILYLQFSCPSDHWTQSYGSFPIHLDFRLVSTNNPGGIAKLAARWQDLPQRTLVLVNSIQWQQSPFSLCILQLLPFPPLISCCTASNKVFIFFHFSHPPLSCTCSQSQRDRCVCMCVCVSRGQMDEVMLCYSTLYNATPTVIQHVPPPSQAHTQTYITQTVQCRCALIYSLIYFEVKVKCSPNCRWLDCTAVIIWNL